MIVLSNSNQPTVLNNRSQVKDWRVGKRPLSDDEILGNAITFMIVGYETTASALAWMIHLLAFYPDAQQKLFDEVSEAPGLIDWEDERNCVAGRGEDG